VAHLFIFSSSWFENGEAMALKDILEDFVKYKQYLDELDRNDTESSTVETYEKQFMVCYSISDFLSTNQDLNKL